MSNPEISILLIEDNLTDVELVSEMLKDHVGWHEASTYRLTHANRLDEGLRRLRGTNFNLVLIDLSLPDSGGLNTFHRLRQAAPHMPLIILSGNNDAALATQAVREGAQDYLDKNRLDRYSLARAIDYALERKRAEEQIRYQAHVLESIHDAIVSTDLNSNILSWNKAAEIMFGYTAAEALGRPGHELMHIQHLTATREEALRHVLQTGRWEGEAAVQRKDGSLGYVLISTSLLEDSAGQATGVLATAHDITERKRAEEALAASERRFRALIDNSADAIALLDGEGKLLEFNSQAAGNILGYSMAENIGLSVFELIHPDDRAPASELFQRLLETPDSPLTAQLCIRHKDGSWRWVEVTASNLIDEPAVNAIVVNYRDITARKQAQEALAARERRFRALIENSADAIALLDGEGKILYESPAATRILGYAAEDLLGRNAFEFLHPGDAPAAAARFAEIIQQPGEPVSAIVRYRHKNDSWRWVEATGSNLLGDPSVGAIVVNYRDVTTRMDAEHELERYVFQLSVLNSVAVAAAQAEDEDDLVTRVTAIIGATLYSDNFGILLVNPAGDALTPHPSYHGLGDKPHPHTIPLNEGITGSVAFLGQPQYVPDVSQAPEFIDLMTGMRSELCVPIKLGDRVLGVINAESARLDAFNSDDEQVLITIAGQLATAIEKIRLLDALRGSEVKHRTLVEQLPAITYEVALGSSVGANRTTYISPQVETILGFTVEEWMADPGLWIKQLHPDDRERVIAEVVNRDAQSQSLDLEYRVVARDGRVLWFRNQYALVPHEPGRPAVLHGLMLDITERKLAEQQLRLQAIALETAANAIVITDRDGAIEWVNPAFTALTGYTLEESLGRNPRELVRSGLHDKVFYQKLWNTILAGQVWRGELINRRKDGALYHEEQTITPVTDTLGRVTHLVAIKQNVTARKQRERELQAIATLSTALRSAANRSEMIPIVLTHVIDLLHLESAAVVLRDPLTGDTVDELVSGNLAHLTGLRLPPGVGITGRVIQTGQPYFTNDVRNDPYIDRPDVLGNANVFAAVPLLAQGEAIGALWAAGAGEIGESEMRILAAVADMAANAIRRAALHEETRRRVERLQALRTIDSAINSSLDLRVTLNIVLAQVTAQLEVDAASVLLYHPTTQQLDFAAGYGFHTRSLERISLSVATSVAGRVVLERQPVRLDNIAEAGQAMKRAAALAAEGLTAYYGLPLLSKGIVKGVLELFHRAPMPNDPDWLEFADTLAGQSAIAIDNLTLFDELQRSNADLSLAYDTTLEGWSRALDLRDEETEGHSQRVTEMAVRMGQELGLGEAEIVNLRRGALLHDIGKMGIPDSILLKPGKLTDEEWAVMRKHPEHAHNLLKPITFLHAALDIPYCHHEKWDGTGYPRGLKGHEIPLAARIFAVADVWDALNSDRPYRPAWPKDKIRAYIVEQSGQHFDPQIVEVFLKLFD